MKPASLSYARVLSVVFVGTALIGVLAPLSESSARADAPRAAHVAVARGAAGLAAATGAAHTCPSDMVEVEGDYCPNVEQRCTRWIDPEGTFPRRCAEFAPSGSCQGKAQKKHFCIDRFEYPNKTGERPVVMKSWNDAQDACKAQGKRLCGDSEWTLACEGRERLAYPYGLKRDAEACNIDKPHPDVNEKALASSDAKVRDGEVARLWQGEPSGARAACVSPFGVADMTGNVDEWVVNESGHPFKSGSKGGYWGPVRDRCRPMTTVHNEEFAFYQLGFRCCGDP
jgi:sulfatase-modifying factor enzyme 1